MFWPFIFMMSPMMFDAPGSENDKSSVISALLFLSYPIVISLVLWMFGGNYFGVNGFTLTIISTAVIVLGFTVFGYFGMLSNLAKGIANSGYSIANSEVYYDGNRIDDADSESFVVLEGEGYSYNNLWHAKDKNYLYYSGVIVQGANTENLKPVKVYDDTYWLNSTQVIYGDGILPGANPDQFSGFEGIGLRGWTYSIRDEQYFVYFYGKRLPDVDRDSFTPLSEFFAKDKHHIFEKDQAILPDADAESFELFEDHSFGSDKNRIYYLAHTQPFSIKDIDKESFEILGWNYLGDKNHIYLIHQYKSIEKLDQIDVASFEVTAYDELTRSHARDKNHFYYDGEVVSNREN